MSVRHPKVVTHAGYTAKNSESADKSHARWSIFSIPKPFVGRDGIAQRNAIGSWLRLIPGEQILILGDAPGTADAAQEFGLQYAAALDHNERGTPLLNNAFATATKLFRSELLMYVNADIMLDDDMGWAMARLLGEVHSPFLGIGGRVNIDVEGAIDWRDPNDLRWLRQRASSGTRESVLCKDYFVFPRGWFANVPAFAVGRGNWDNWMVFAAKKMKMKVIDLSSCAIAIHPNHGHDHVEGGRRAAYVHGAEARINQRLAGGRHWIRGSTSNWMLTLTALRPQPFARLQLTFWRDLPRIARLAWRLFRR